MAVTLAPDPRSLAVTPTDWHRITSAKRMIRRLRLPPADPRVIRFHVACCRRLSAFLHEPGLRDAVGALEAFAAGRASADELRAAFVVAESAAAFADLPRLAAEDRMRRDPMLRRDPIVRDDVVRAGRVHHAAFAVVEALRDASHRSDVPDFLLGSTSVLMRCQNALAGEGPVVGEGAGEDEFGVDAPRRAESVYQAGLVRCIFDDPDHGASPGETPRTATVLSLARAAYDERDSATGELDALRLMILADALEEAGATDADLLGHLRGPGPHVRGCWALDLVVGKE